MYAVSSSPLSRNASSFVAFVAVTLIRIDSRSSSANAGWPSSGLSEPSDRMIGGISILRWMSVAPASTAVLSSVFRSMAGPGSHRQVQVDSLGGLRSFQPIRAAGVARGAREALDDTERHPDEALRPVGVPARRAKLGLDRTPGERKAGDPVRQARKALERELRPPRCGRVRAQCARERRCITVEVA